ncbi:SDR family NAD(P)-dependent oxidoreductase [Paraburkholderia sediminicola]|uniref:SDR family NAD(P)-dependent oxidoreductase n=1 Tax=Paraburkholderia sediminicola TaxID=458836 RepID=UPI0038BB169B
MKLENKVAIVTGAQRGIGLAIAMRFATDGATVVIADLNDAMQEVAALRAAGHEACFIPTDVSRETDVTALIGWVTRMSSASCHSRSYAYEFSNWVRTCAGRPRSPALCAEPHTDVELCLGD